MLVWTLYSLFKVNQERVKSLIMRVKCASSLTDGILLFYSGINNQKGDVICLFRFCFIVVYDLGF